MSRASDPSEYRGSSTRARGPGGGSHVSALRHTGPRSAPLASAQPNRPWGRGRDGGRRAAADTEHRDGSSAAAAAPRSPVPPAARALLSVAPRHGAGQPRAPAPEPGPAQAGAAGAGGGAACLPRAAVSAARSAPLAPASRCTAGGRSAGTVNAPGGSTRRGGALRTTCSASCVGWGGAPVGGGPTPIPDAPLKSSRGPPPASAPSRWPSFSAVGQRRRCHM